MAADVDIKMGNNATGERFLFRAVSNFRVRKIQPPISIPLVDTSPENTFLFRFIGQSEEISFDFAIFDDNTDVSDSSHATEIKTVAEQIKYLKNDIYTKDFDQDFSLNDMTGKFYESALASAIRGVITNLDLSQSAGAGTVIPGTITFQRGRIVDL